ncbi:MAG: hypothetical protein KF729_38475 [Sandaracinaceae bacterium]|nr:hypothetical protein [Sandaracinaceae bacterium]
MTLPCSSWARALAALLLTGCPSAHGGDAGAAGYDACRVPSECVVVPASCCGACGAARRGDAVAVSVARADAYRAVACGGDPTCPACFSPPDPTLVATCEADRCVVVDLSRHPASECAASSDCRVRASACCECGATISESTVVAVSNEAAYAALVCDPGTACPECAPVYPAEYGAVCDAGRCAMVFADRP